MFPKLLEWLKQNKARVVLYSVLLVALLLAAQFIRDLLAEKDRLHTELVGQKQAYRQLSEHAAQLAVEYKSQADLLEEVEVTWRAEKHALEGRIKILSNATFLIREAARREGRSDLVYEGKSGLKYLFNEIRFNDGPPVGYVLIFDDGRVTSKLYNHIIDVKTAVSRDEASGRYSILSKADFVLKSPHLSTEKNWLNVPYPLKIVGGTAHIDPTEPNQARKRFHLWSPVINGGFNLGADLKPAVGVSLMGYGYSPRDLDWKLLQLGVDYSRENGAGIHLIPALYRPFPNVLRNTYIGAGIGIDKRPIYNPFLSLSIGF